MSKFRFKNGRIPSYVTISAFIRGTDFSGIQNAFYKWDRNYVPIEQGEWIAIDGKSILSTVNDSSTSFQNFVSLVSLLCTKKEYVLYSEKFESKTGNEINVVYSLLEFLDLRDVVFTLDAAHCPKKL